MAVKIRDAKPEDVKRIYELAKSVKLDKEKPHANGFLVYILDEDGYREKMELSDLFYVAEENGEIVAFFMGYDDKFIEQLMESSEIKKDDPVFSFVMKQKRPFVFGYQLAVDYNHSYRGIGKMLMDRLFEDMLKKGITEVYADILHKPIENTASKNFVISIGCKFIRDVDEGDGYIWGIYKIGGEGEN